MVRFDAYAEKIRKVAVFKNIVVKFRVLIISVLALITASTTAYLISKGSVINNVTLSPTFTYGEEITVEEGKALFSDYYYEYSLAGSGIWSEEKPIAPGKYEVRIVTNKSFKQKGYSDPVPFEIFPKEISIDILDETVEYGKTPSNVSTELQRNDQLVKQDLTYTFDSLVLESTNVSVNSDSVVIINENNEDITHYYKINTPKKSVRFVDKNIIVRPEESSKVYDGLASDYVTTVDNSTLESLIDGDSITFDTVIKDSKGNILEKNPTNVGTYTIEVVKDSIVLSRDDDSVIHQYGLTIQSSTLTILPRDITISTASDDKIYDGTALVNKEYEISDGSLVNGHKLSYANNDETSITDVNIDGIDNVYKFVVLNENDEDISSQYNIQYSYGKLSIKSKDIVVDLGEFNKVYDGQSFTLEDIEFYVNTDEVRKVLPSGMNFKVVSTDIANYIDANTYTYNAVLEVIDTQGENVSSNFTSILVNDGTIIIDKSEINIQLNDIDDVIYGETYNYLSGSNNFTSVISGTIANNEELEVGIIYKDINGNIVNPTNVGVYYIHLDVSNSYIYRNGTKTSTKNYIITENIVEDFNILHRTANIGIIDLSKVYDGKTFERIDIENYIAMVSSSQTNAFNLLTGHALVINSTNVEECGLNYTETSEGFVTTFTVIDSMSNDVTSNYVSESLIANGTVYIAKKDIPLTLPVLEKAYDGHSFEDSDIEQMINDEFMSVNNHRFEITTNVNETYNATANGQYVVSSLEVYNQNNENVTSNFILPTLVGESGLVRINQKAVNIELSNLEATYGDAIVFDEYPDNYLNPSTSGIVEGEQLVVSIYFKDGNGNKVTPKNVGEYYVAIDVSKSKIIKDGVEYFFDNYRLEPLGEYNYSSMLNITHRIINVEYSIADHIYDGQPYQYNFELNNYDNYSTIDLAYDEKLAIGIRFGDSDPLSSKFITPINVGTYLSELDPYNTYIYTPEGEYVSVLENYAVHSTKVNLNIVQREIKIKALDVNKGEYNREIHVYDSYLGNYELIEGSLANGEELMIATYLTKDNNEISALDAGTYDININRELSEIYKDGSYYDNGINNYDIEVVDGATLTIEKRNISIELLDLSKDYDGSIIEYEMYEENYHLISGSMAYLEHLQVSVYYVDSNGEKVEPKEQGEYYAVLDLENSVVGRIMGSYDNTGDFPAIPTEPTELPDVIYIEYGDTSNYNITCPNKFTRIDTCKVNIQLLSGLEQTYSGEAFVYPDELNNYDSVSNTVKDEMIKVAVTFEDMYGNPVTPIDAGIYFAVLDQENCKVYNTLTGEWSDSSNYKLTAEKTPIFILRKEVVITTASDENIPYDGKAHSNQDFTVSDIASPYAELGHVVVRKDPSAIVEVTNVYDENNIKYNNVYEFIIVDAEGNDVTHNYDLSGIIYGSITIAPKEVNIEFLEEYTQNVIYGDSITYLDDIGNFKYVDENNTLVEGDNLKIAFAHYWSKDSTEGVLLPERPNVGNVTISYVNSDSKVYKDGMYDPRYIQNYEIVCANKTFEITQKTIHMMTIELEDEYAYTGKSFKEYPKGNNNFVLTMGSTLAYDDVLRVKIQYETETGEFIDDPIEMGTYKVHIVDYTVTSGNKVSGNYKIDQVEVDEFKIVKREIVIAPNIEYILYQNGIDVANSSAVYDGKSHQYINEIGNYSIISAPEDYEIPEFKISVSFKNVNTGGMSSSITNAGTYELIINSDTNTHLGFILTYSSSNTDLYGQTLFTITPYEYELLLNSEYEQTYGDKEVYEQIQLVNNETVKIGFEYYYNESLDKVDGVPTEVLFDQYGNVIPYVIKVKTLTYSKDANNYLITNNYLDITSNYYINQRRYNISSYDYTDVYNDKEHSDSRIKSISNLLKDHTAIVLSSTTVKYVTSGTDNELVIKIIDKDGNDVTKNYLVNAQNWGTIVIKHREISISTDDLSRPYNGEALVSNGKLYVDNIVTEHSVVITSELASITNVGSVSNRFNYIIVDALGVDVTSNYKVIKENYGTITVTKRIIYLNPKGDTTERQYSGYEYYYDYANMLNNFEYAGDSLTKVEHQLVNGDQIVISVYFIDSKGNPVPAVDALTYKMGVREYYDVYDINGNRLNVYNYEIKLVNKDMIFTIDQRDLSVEIEDIVYEKTYDGNPFIFNNTYKLLEETTLADNQNLSLKVIYKDVTGNVVANPTNYGTYSISIDEVNSKVIFQGKDVTANYDIDFSKVNRTLNIHKRAITVQLNYYEKTYDKEIITIDDLTYSHYWDEDLSEPGFVSVDAKYFSIEEIQFYLDGQAVSADKVINKDEYSVSISKYSLAEYVSDNYTITILEGNINILARIVYIQPTLIDNDGNNFKDYDGRAYIYNGEYKIISGSLAGSVEKGNLDTLSIEVRFDGNLISDYYEESVSYYNQVTEAALYTSHIYKWYVNGFEDLAENYDVVNVSAMYRIDKRPITVSNGDVTEIYTGERITAKDVISLEESIKDLDDRNFIASLGHSVERNRREDIFYKIDVKDTPCANEQNVSIMCGSEEVTHNYNVTLVHGTITILPKAVTVTTTLDEDKTTKTYDGKQFNIGNKFKVEGLATDIKLPHSITAYRWPTMIDAGVYENYEFAKTGKKYNIIISDAGGNTIDLENYAFSFVVQTITIEKLTIKITPQEVIEQFCGKNFEFDYEDLIIQNYDKEKVTVKITDNKYVIYDKSTNQIVDAIKYIGEYEIHINKSDLYVDNKKTQHNYNIDADDVIIVDVHITPNVLVHNESKYIQTASDAKLYDGTPLSAPYFHTNVILPEGYAFKVKEGSEVFVLEPGEYKENKLELIIVDEKGIDVTDNFEMKVSYGSLSIYNSIRFTHGFTYNGEEIYQINEKISGHRWVDGVDEGFASNISYLDYSGTYVGAYQESYDYSKGEYVYEKLDYTPKESGTYFYIAIKDLEIYVHGKKVSEETLSEFNILNNRTEEGYYLISTYIYYPSDLIIKPSDITVDYTIDEKITHGINDVEYVTGLPFGSGRLVNEYHVIQITTDEKWIGNDGTKFVPNARAVIVGYNIIDTRTGEDVTHNYNVYSTFEEFEKNYNADKYKVNKTHFQGVMSIVKRDIEIYAYAYDYDLEYNNASYDVEYDKATGGKELYDIVSFENNTYRFTNPSLYGLLPNHYIEITSAKVTATSLGRKSGWLQVTIKDENGVVVRNGYNIRFTNNNETKMNIIGRKLTVESGSASQAYDGSTLVCEEWTATEDKLLSGTNYQDILEVVITGENGHVGTVTNTIGSVKVLRNYYRNGVVMQTVDVTQFYDIEKIEGTLTNY